MSALTVFISGTMKDLPKEREQVATAIRTMGLTPIWAEQQGARSRSSQEECERMSSESDVYLGLYGLNYGWKMPPDNRISATEFEWRTAKARRKPMLIYLQRGTPESEQDTFVTEVRKWQSGNFTYTFDNPDDLIPRLREDLSTLIKDSFRPQGQDDDLLEHEVKMCLEGLGYKVQTNQAADGLVVPILAEYHNALVIPQSLAVGCRSTHVPNLIGAALANRFSGVVYVVQGDAPAELAPVIGKIHCVNFDNLLDLAGTGRAEAQLRRAAWEWKHLGSTRLLSYDEFERVSEYRRQMAPRLAASDLTYALRCSIQHGKNLPFWSRANSGNEEAIDAILYPFTHNWGRRPLLRAGYALEKLNSNLHEMALQSARKLPSLDAMRCDVLAAAASRRTRDAWSAELKHYLDEGGFTSLLFQQIDEPEQ